MLIISTVKLPPTNLNKVAHNICVELRQYKEYTLEVFFVLCMHEYLIYQQWPKKTTLVRRK